jgi:hypothetical protein
MHAAATVALGTIAAQAGSLSALTLARFVLHTSAELTIHEGVLSELIRRRFESAE